MVGGVLSENISWRWIFYINLPIGALALGILLLCLPATRYDNESNDLMSSWREKWLRVDFVGAALFLGSVSCFLLATQWGGTRYPWSSAIILGLYGGCVLLGASTVMASWFHLSSREPILTLHLFKMRDQVVVYVMALMFCMAMFMNVYYLPLYFQVVHGDGAMEAGIEILPYLLPVDCVSIASGYILARTGHYRMMFLIGNGTIILGGALQSLLSADSGHVEQIIFLMITGIGVGFCIQKYIQSYSRNWMHY